jgi:peptidoglycan/xylan/chitin deacetylase (PgdA/CDA1 family)
VGAEGFLTVDQLSGLVDAGWEIGTHTATHPDLTAAADLSAEIYGSKRVLDRLLGIEVQTLAYPYGRVDRRVFRKVSNYGFLAVVCLNPSNHQTRHKLFCLSRREVKYGCSLEEFRGLLQPDR